MCGYERMHGEKGRMMQSTEYCVSSELGYLKFRKCARGHLPPYIIDIRTSVTGVPQARLWAFLHHKNVGTRRAKEHY